MNSEKHASTISLFNSEQDEFSGLISGDIETLMRTMDSVYKTKFSEWVKNEENIDFIVENLSKIPHSPDDWYIKFAKGVNWIAENWSEENLASILFRVSFKWSEIEQILILRTMSRSWNKMEKTYKVLGYFVKDMPALEASDLLLKVSFDWEIDDSINLLKYLVASSTWDTSKLRIFVALFTRSLKELIYSHKSTALKSAKAIQETKMSIAELKLGIAKYKLAVANFNLSVANFKLRNSSCHLPEKETSTSSASSSVEKDSHSTFSQSSLVESSLPLDSSTTENYTSDQSFIPGDSSAAFNSMELPDPSPPRKYLG